ncbi:MAG: hydantoinase/oxoprolinase N-terminal domain-containing protein [Canibacter sp.]
MSYRIGVDVGGTNTDAVILDENLSIITSVKSPTTEKSIDGVLASVQKVLAQSGVDPARISTVTLGTTHCTNAIVQRKSLSKVGVIRIGGPATSAVPPFEGWPADLRETVETTSVIVNGGHEFNGREIAGLDETAIRDVCEDMRGNVDAVAIIGVFSPVVRDHEERAADIVREVLGVPMSLSHEVGSVGLLERENATILNAALIHTLESMVTGLETALQRLGIRARLFLGQNDGTLMQLDFALRFPVYTIGSGPTNSIRGAAHLSGMQDALVVDVGGTTSDIGVLVAGFPRQSSHATTIGGIRTNFRMPDVLSVGLGGGTVVHSGTQNNDELAVRIGPDSVGYRITSEALTFGGATLTATDIAVKSGRLSIENTQGPEIDDAVYEAGEAEIRKILEEHIDQMKPSAQAAPVVLVGGGAAICPDQLQGVSQVIVPDHSGAANAVGAAIGDASGQAEQVFSLKEVSRADAVSTVKREAIQRAIDAGADPVAIEVMSVEDLPMAYIDDAIIVTVRASGRLL